MSLESLFINEKQNIKLSCENQYKCDSMIYTLFKSFLEDFVVGFFLKNNNLLSLQVRITILSIQYAKFFLVRKVIRHVSTAGYLWIEKS